MAQAGPQLNRETLSCSICLDLLKDPVTIACGHSYCRTCIQNHWDVEEEKRVYSCPQCRQTFKRRPFLGKSTMLAALVEQLKKTGIRDAPADHCYAGDEDVACDVCTGRKLKAHKSCLVCRASYCDSHLQPHRDAAPLQKHKLVEPTQELQKNICPQHDDVMKIFCRTDQQCICCLCSVEKHKGHDTVSAAAERTERQRELEGARQKIQQRIQDTEEDVKVLQMEVEAIHRSADEAVKDSDKIFTQMIRLLDKRRSEVKQQVKLAQKAELSRIKALQRTLEQEITELQRTDAKLENISHTQDHIQFLNNFSSMSGLSQTAKSSSLEIRPIGCFEDVTAAVSELRDKIQGVLMETWTNISQTAISVDAFVPEPETETREDFLRYSCEITLDPNTAHKNLSLSKRNRKVTNMRRDQFSWNHPDRFIGWRQVLSRESLTGRCYWEVEGRGTGVHVAVSYKNIRRTGSSEECLFGLNDKSWALRFLTGGYEFCSNNIRTAISGPVSSRVGVFLDHRAGVLSFYSVSGTMTLLHRLQTTFTQPLHAGVGVYDDDSTAEFSQLT